jgi:hypothetical protein
VTRVRRGYLLAALTVPTMLLLAGCPEPAPPDVTTQVDRDRAAVLQADPMVAKAVGPVKTTVGRVIGNQIGWDRTQVDLVLYDRAATAPPPVPTPEQFQARVAAGLQALRAAGWRVIWTRCQAPQPPQTTPRAGASATASPSAPVSQTPSVSDWWVWTAYGYKIAGGVSYGFDLRAEYFHPGNGSVGLILRAPNHRDPANLFPDAPPALAAGTTCIEQPKTVLVTQSNGVQTWLSSGVSLPRPTGSTDPVNR